VTPKLAGARSVKLALPRKLWVLLALGGVLVAAVFALVPVTVRFGDDPLLRLRELDPELSPPPTNAVCGSPVRSLNVEPADTSLYELARASACEDAGRRRLAAAVAGGLLIVVSALLGRAATSPRPPRVPVPTDGGALPSG